MAASPINCLIVASHASLEPAIYPLHVPFNLKLPLIPLIKKTTPKFLGQHIRATLDDKAQISSTPSISMKERTQLNEVRHCCFKFVLIRNTY